MNISSYFTVLNIYIEQNTQFHIELDSKEGPLSFTDKQTHRVIVVITIELKCPSLVHTLIIKKGSLCSLHTVLPGPSLVEGLVDAVPIKSAKRTQDYQMWEHAAPKSTQVGYHNQNVLPQ